MTSRPDPQPGLELMRGTALIGLPVVGIASGNALGDVKDVLYDAEAGAILGLTLNKRGGLFAGPMKHPLAAADVFAIGRDAVMVPSDDPWSATADEARRATAGSRNVLGNDVLTDAGERLGVVTDLIVVIGELGRGSAGEVVGYQIRGEKAVQGREGGDLLVPLPDTLAVSGSHLVVPASTAPYVRGDLSGFGLAVEEFRAQLGKPLGTAEEEES